VIGDILQPTHLLFVLVIALLVLGPKRLPEVGRALGNGLRDFKSAINGEDDRHEQITDAPGFESYRSEALGDESHDGTPAAEHQPAPASAHEPAPVASSAEPAEHTSSDVPPVTSPSEPAPPAHPEDVSAAAAAEPSSTVASQPATERTERLG
jgi:sec-independent protein translocase protein TatA